MKKKMAIIYFTAFFLLFLIGFAFLGVLAGVLAWLGI